MDNMMIRLTSFTNVICFTSVQQCSIVIALTVPAPASIAKYSLRAELSSNSLSGWTIRFLDVNGIKISHDTRTSDTLTTNQSR